MEQRLSLITPGVFVDPDGNPWEVAHHPHWTIEDDGSVRI
jgi:uncharacterized protein